MAKRMRMNEDLNAEFQNMKDASSNLINLCEEVRDLCDNLEALTTEIEDRATFLWELDDPDVDYNFANYSEEEKERILVYIEKRLNFYSSKLGSYLNSMATIYNRTDDVLSDIKQFDDTIGANI